MIGLVSKLSGKTKKKLKEIRREENPVVCIMKFYQFLELHLKHRVKAKMGRSLKVDHMTMRHITKSSQVSTAPGRRKRTKSPLHWFQPDNRTP